MTEVAAILLAAVATGLAAGGRPSLLRTRLGAGRPRHVPTTAAPPARAEVLGRDERAGDWAAAAAMAGLPGAGALGLVSPAVGLLGAVTGLLLWRMRARRRRSRHIVQREEAVADICLALAAELRSGAPAGKALREVGEEWPELLGLAAGRVEIGADAATELRAASQQAGAGALAAVAVGWEVAERTGAGLASVLVAVADTLRAERTVRHEARAQLATVRATARLMAVLPFGTLLLISGGAGIEFLTQTTSGMACLAAAVLLVAVGLAWVDRMSRAALRPAWDR